MGVAKTCVEKLITDYHRIKDTYIDNGDYESAALYWRASLSKHHVLALKDRIQNEVHMGLSLVVTAEMLRGVLDEAKPLDIASTCRFFEMYAAQTKLPIRD